MVRIALTDDSGRWFDPANQQFLRKPHTGMGTTMSAGQLEAPTTISSFGTQHPVHGFCTLGRKGRGARLRSWPSTKTRRWSGCLETTTPCPVMVLKEGRGEPPGQSHYDSPESMLCRWTV
jgi:hypothetical protein